jgi:aryl-alcohol dehydrogenase-like predicted oxidoreductase
VLAGTVLAQGHVIKGKIGRLRTLADLWYLARATLKAESRNLAKCSAGMRDALTAADGMTPAQAAISFVLEQSPVASCIVGTTKIPNLQEILAASGRSLSASDTNAIRRAFEAQPLRISK